MNLVCFQCFVIINNAMRDILTHQSLSVFLIIFVTQLLEMESLDQMI